MRPAPLKCVIPNGCSDLIPALECLPEVVQLAAGSGTPTAPRFTAEGHRRPVGRALGVVS